MKPTTISNIDFHYNVTLDFEKEYINDTSEDHDYHTYDERILSAKIQNINYISIYNYIIKNLGLTKQSTIVLYCLDRIFRINKLYHPDSYEVFWEPGYYGDEVTAVKIHSSIATSIEDQIKKVLGSINPIEDTLTFEYGYVLEKLQNKKYTIFEKIPFSQLKIGNDNYYEKLSKGSNEYALIPGLPVGLYLKRDDGTYRLVDGYHRLVSLDKEKSYTIIVVE